MQIETTKPAASRYLWADWIRGIGILLVILGHVSGIVVQRFQNFNLNDWMAGNVYNVIARSCVPLLFMVSGALLLPRQESLRDFYRKRFQKVIFPFLFWSVLYILSKESFADYTFVNAVKAIVKIILTRPAEYHLWFMYELLAIYLFTPVLRVFVNNANEEQLWYLMAIWFLFGPVQRFLEFQFQFELIVDLGYLTGYVGYFLLGYLLTRIRITKTMLWAAAAVYVGLGVYTGYVTYIYTDFAGKLVDYFQYLLGLNIVLLAASLYILLKAWGDRLFSAPHPWLEKVAVNLTSASFGMYLVHVFVLDFLKRYSISPLDGPAIYMIPVTTLVVFIISWIIIAILQKIPYVRSLVA